MDTTNDDQEPKTGSYTSGRLSLVSRSPELSIPAGSTASTAETSHARILAVIDSLACIGRPPEARGYIGTGIAPELRGTRVEAFATVDAGTQRPTRVGRSWLFKHSHVGHDAIIGDGCEISTGAVIGGWVEIGNNVRVGLNAVVRPRVKIGDGAQVGAGAVVVKDVPAGMVVVGNPARILRETR